MYKYLLGFLFFIFIRLNNGQYTANWTSLDTRPLPLWYDEAKFGIFTHWGVYSVPAYDSEWFWHDWQSGKCKSCAEFMATHYRPNTTYQDFAAQFTAIDFNATFYAELVKASGAKYVVITTKHHEGYTLWPNDQAWNWNAMDVGPGRDLVAEVRNAILAVGDVHWGTYFSLMDWYHPFYLSDKINYNKTGQQLYVNEIYLPQLTDLVNNYQPDLIWGDGEWEMPGSYWNSTQFLAWLFNDSPVKDTVVVNDRWGSDIRCHHGSYVTCGDRFEPAKLQPKKYESGYTVDAISWGYRRTLTLSDVHTLQSIISTLVEAISTGGNFLINIGPDHNGRISPIFEERLRGLGSFANAHSEAIYSTKPWVWQNDSDSTIWYTSQVRNNATLDPRRLYNNQTENNTIIYAFVRDWPENNLVNLSHVLPTAQTTVNLFGASGFIPLQYTQPLSLNGGIQVDISGISLKKFPSTDAFALKIEYAADQNVNPLGNNNLDHHLVMKDKTF